MNAKEQLIADALLDEVIKRKDAVSLRFQNLKCYEVLMRGVAQRKKVEAFSQPKTK